MQNSKHCVVLTSDSSDYEVEKILFEDEWINDCMTAEVTIKRHLCYKWEVMSMICI